MDTIYAILRYFEPAKSYKSRIAGVLILLLSAFLIITFKSTLEFLVSFVQSSLSKDHILNASTVSDISHYYAYFIIFLGFTGLLILQNFHIKIFNFAAAHINLRQLKLFLFTDPAVNSKVFSSYLFYISSVTGVLLSFFFTFYGRPKQEGYLEDMEAIMLLCSSVIMTVSALLYSVKSQKKTAYKLFAAAVVIFIMFGEEISWGQRLIGFHSPAFFNENNYQGEFNLHNFFNPLYDVLYKVVGISLFSGLSLLWFFGKEKHNPSLNLLLPPPSFSFLIFLIACSTFGNREIFEVLLYIFLLLYSIRIYVCAKYPGEKPL
jgi:hypothetical protein